jgi:hypothetical protein
MANVDLSAQSAIITGRTAVVGTCQTAVTGTITITASAGSALDLSKLALRIENKCTITGVTVLCSIQAGTIYSGINLGVYSFAIGGTSTSVYVGGKDFESARFLKQTTQSIVLSFSFASATNATDITTLTEVVSLPGGFTA